MSPVQSILPADSQRILLPGSETSSSWDRKLGTLKIVHLGDSWSAGNGALYRNPSFIYDLIQPKGCYRSASNWGNEFNKLLSSQFHTTYINRACHGAAAPNGKEQMRYDELHYSPARRLTICLPIRVNKKSSQTTHGRLTSGLENPPGLTLLHTPMMLSATMEAIATFFHTLRNNVWYMTKKPWCITVGITLKRK